MKKSELIEEIAKKTGFTKVDTDAFVRAFIDSVTETLKKGEDVRLVGFGTFAIHKRKATMGRNPRTGEPIKILATNQAKFKAGKVLKEELN